MIKNIYILIAATILMISACSDPFELTRNDIIQEELVFEDENLANAFLADLYADALFQYISGQSNYDMNLINAMGGEARNFAPWQAPFGQVIGPVFNETGAGVLNYWPYAHIRECNVFIEKLGESSLDPDYVDARVSEARFIRAHAYFEMVKRYGGVPIVLEAQDIDASEAELFVSRNSEKEVYDFLGDEMDAIAALLPGVAEDDGRVTKWAALAMKSRVMLYAASVAKFGTEQLDGLLGFPASEAESYYQKSLAASKEILDDGPFALYRKQDDKVQNFTDLFVDENGNTEVILAEKWDAASGKGHGWDGTCHPDGYGYSWNSNYPTYLEKLELFDFVDGSSGKVDRAMYDDETPIDPEWYFNQRDPRMRASISYPGMPWRGQRAFYHISTDYTDPADGMVKRSTDRSLVIPGSDGWLAAGPNRNVGAAVTSLQIRKRLDENLQELGAGRSSTDFHIFRLGEIMLNYVEAAYYLGDPNGDMAHYLNDEIRDRAGMPAIPQGEITEDRIRQERQVELAFEQHVFWDLRRWRIAVQELDNVQKTRMFFRYNFDTKMYTISTGDGDRGNIRSHTERNYYYALGIGRIADNPNLVENPGY